MANSVKDKKKIGRFEMRTTAAFDKAIEMLSYQYPGKNRAKILEMALSDCLRKRIYGFTKELGQVCDMLESGCCVD